MFVSLLLAMGAFNSQNNLLFWALGFSFAAMIVSGILSGRMLMGLRAARLNSPAGHAGDLVHPAYRVLNANRIVPGFALGVRDLAISDPHRSGDKAGNTRRPIRAVWWRRWLGLAGSDADAAARVPARPHATIERVGFVQHVSPRGHCDCVASVRALRRGVIKLRILRVETAFPFGLIRKAIDFDVRGELVIWPRLLELDPAILRGAMQAGTSPRTPSRRRGDGDEFLSLREYVEGDSPRSIAWRVSAQRMSAGSPDHMGLLVRQTVAPSPSRVWIALDLCGQADYDERAICVAASLAKMAQERGMMFGLSEPFSGVLLPPARGRGHLERLFDALARIDLSATQDEHGRLAPQGALAPKAATSDGTMCVVVHGHSRLRSNGDGSGGLIGGSRAVHVDADDPNIERSAGDGGPIIDPGGGRGSARTRTAIAAEPHPTRGPTA